MKEYYIHEGGKQFGPFSLNELRDRGLTSTTMVWFTGAGNWLPVSEVEELAAIVGTKPPPLVVEANVPGGNSGSISKTSQGGRQWIILTVVLVVLLVLIGAITYYRKTQEKVEQRRKKEWVRSIHEKEVKKTIKEQQAEKIARKQTEAQRRDSLEKNRAQLKSLNAKLSGVLAERDDALEELQDIQKPRLFKSRKKMARQSAEQQAYIKALENKAGDIRSKIARCKRDIDRLAASLNE